jgi:hypothetical protein
VVAAVVLVAVLLAFFRNTGKSLDTPLSNKEAVVVKEPPHVPVPPGADAASKRTLSTFFRTAVIRRDTARAWPLATAHMKEGTTNREWLQGTLPVVPYPAAAYRAEGARLRYSYKGILGYDVLIVPKQNAAGNLAGQQVYACELHDVHGRWLIDYCYPRKTL